MEMEKKKMNDVESNIEVIIENLAQNLEKISNALMLKSLMD